MLTRCLAACLLFICLLTQAMADDSELQLLSRSKIVLEDPGLSPPQWRWVRKHQRLRLAVWKPMSPPYDITTGLSDYGGINADFIGIIADNLNLKIEVIRYASYRDALNALSADKADIIAQASNSPQNSGLLLSQPYSKNLPVEVINIDAPPLQQKMNIAICPQYDKKEVMSHYPDAHLTSFSSNRHALEALSFRNIDLFLCDAVTVQYLISQSNLTNLSSQPISLPFKTKGFAFAALPREKMWLDIINSFLNVLPASVSVEIHRRWNGGIPLSLSEQRPIYTRLEKKWIEEHQTIRVAVVTDNKPVSWFNNSGQLRGIVADILTALRLRTGFKFDIKSYANYSEALKAVKTGQSDVIAGASQESIWQYKLLTTRTWLYNSWVMVGKRNTHVDMQTPRIVTQRAQSPEHWLEQLNDDRLRTTDSWRSGLKNVLEGKSDIMIMPLVVANDWLSNPEYASLKILGSVDTPPMRFSFGAANHLYSLAMILNKALINIPPEDLHAITRNSVSSNDLSIAVTNPFRTYKSLWLTLAACLATLLGLGVWSFIVIRRKWCLMTESKQRADSANHIKSHFLATMSHEIRTPINAIIGLLELVMHRPQDTEVNRQRIQVAWQGGQSLLALIGNILDVSRIEANKLVLYPHRTPLLTQLESIAVLFEGTARQKGLAFNLEIDSELAVDVLIDPSRFRQIVTNLLSNAIKFTASGSVTLRAIHHSQDAGNLINLHVIIEDTGSGIEPAIQQRLFHPFVQGEDRLVGQGSGLGLYICRKLTEMMGGEISLKSQPLQGTEVIVILRLPRLAPIDPPPREKTNAVEQPIQNLRVVVVDDNSAGRMLLEHQLLHLGHRAVSFSEAAQALPYLAQHPVDIMITDCNMPGIDGFQLTSIVRSEYPSMMIIGVTADARDSTSEAALEAGMNACLFKPITLDMLIDCIKGPPITKMTQPSCTIENFDEQFPLPESPLLQGENGRIFLTLQIIELEKALSWMSSEAILSTQDIHSKLHHLRGGIQLLGVPDIEEKCLLLETLPTQEGLHELERSLKCLCQALQERLQEMETVLQENEDDGRP